MPNRLRRMLLLALAGVFALVLSACASKAPDRDLEGYCRTHPNAEQCQAPQEPSEDDDMGRLR